MVNIVTRHDGIDGGAPHAELQTGAGMAGSVYAPSGVLTQRHSMMVRAGSGVGSASLGLSASTLRDFIPDAFDHRFTVSGSGRRVGRTAIVSGILRFVAEDAASPPSPLLATIADDDSLAAPPPSDSAVHQSVRQYTLGGTATVRQGDRWTHRVDSRVRRLAERYTGDFRPGDRMLEVPERTLSATASYARGPWSASVTGSRAFDWVNYDRLALADAVESRDRPRRDLVGEQLRSFWRLYPGVNRLRANLSYDLRRALSLVATADNLLDRQFGEPDNVTVLPGRTIAGGLRARF